MKYFLVLVLFFISLSGYSEENIKSESKEKNHEEHDEEHGAERDKEHDEETSSSVGPNKGITEKGPNGFKLSDEAIKTFRLQTVGVNSTNMTISNQSIVRIKNGKFVFRLKDGWYKRVEIKIIQTNQGLVTIKSAELADGDKIVNAGVGFLRIAEVFSEEGAEHSH